MTGLYRRKTKIKITDQDKIADVLQAYPHLKDRLIERNPKFKRLNNPVVFNIVGKFAAISDVARVLGEDLDALLAFLNSGHGS